MARLGFHAWVTTLLLIDWASVVVVAFLRGKTVKRWLPMKVHHPLTLRPSSFLPLQPQDVVAGSASSTDAATNTTEPSAYNVLLDNIAACLTASDLKRDDGTDGAATGWTAWIDERSAYRLQSCLNRIQINDETINNNDSANNSNKNDDAGRLWSRWFQAAPEPFILDMSHHVRHVLNETMAPNLFQSIGTTPNEFLSRIFLRFIVLPSGSSLPNPVTAPSGSMVYGKLLYGGVTRFRLIGHAQRRAGERQVIHMPSATSTTTTTTRAWLQYGGSPRNYQAVDMGPCLVLEVELLPKGPELAMMGCADTPSSLSVTGIPLAVASHVLPLDSFLQLASKDRVQDDDDDDDSATTTDAAAMEVCDLEDYFCSSTGGLRRQIDEIVRRVLDGRVVKPADESMDNTDTSAELDRIRREEMKGLMELGLHPPKGLLLYGPPGCGKTQLAREISTILNARPPKIVAAPELLDRWVGGSEKLIRELFKDAEDELRACNGDATRSALHVIVIDECDAVFRKRTAQEGSSETTRASAVNQLLSKLDGVNALDNILLIGMTNRRELLDPALLRSGRLEVHVEIPLPDQQGRREILQIHFDALRRRGRLSQPLVEAIDGDETTPMDIRPRQSTRGPKLKLLGEKRPKWLRKSKSVDLASDEYTKGFSGADIAGLVRCAGSIAVCRTRLQDDGSLENLLITLDDVLDALTEVKAGRL